jgi:hypothetical protein
MSMYMYIYMYTSIYTYTYICVQIDVLINMCVYTLSPLQPGGTGSKEQRRGHTF